MLKPKSKKSVEQTCHMKSFFFEKLKLQEKMADLQHQILAMKSTSDPDAMYLWQARRKKVSFR
jgi:hypothetical protein